MISKMFILLLVLGFTLGDFKVQLDTSQIAPAGNVSHLSFSILQYKTNELLQWKQIKKENGRKLHVVIVGKDLDIIGHIHPEDFKEISNEDTSTKFVTQFVFPKAGSYAIGCEFVMGDHDVTQQSFIVNVTGFPIMGNYSELLDWNLNALSFKTFDMNSSEKYIHPIFISQSKLNTSSNSQDSGIIATAVLNRGFALIAGRCYLLQFHLKNSSNNMPITTMVNYLEQPIHLIAVHENLDFIEHFHGYTMQGGMGMGMAKADCNTEMGEMSMLPPYGPDIYASYKFPKVGVYRLFAQSRTEDKLIIHGYLIHVQEPLSIEWLYILGFVFTGVSLAAICVLGTLFSIIRIVRFVRTKKQKGFQKV